MLSSVTTWESRIPSIPLQWVVECDPGGCIVGEHPS